MAQVIAHRGAPRWARENTVVSFRRAVELGADGIELDARRTADDVIVVHHDAAIDGRAIVETRWAELPEHVPTLGAALDACAGAWVNIEIKNSPGEPDFDPDDRVAVAVMAELAERGSESGPWIISSFNLRTVDRCHALDPGVPTALLVVEVDTTTSAVTSDRGHVAIHPWQEPITAEVVDRCHDAGLAVNVWTCNDVQRATDLASWGVDGIVTDIPDLMVVALREG